MTIDDLVDKLLARHKNPEVEAKQEDDQQLPFRYLTDSDEIQQELQAERPTPVSIMDLSEQKSIMELEQQVFTLAMGDTNTIENIIKKHQDLRKNILE